MQQKSLSVKQLSALAAVLLAAGILSYILWTFDPRITEDNRLLEMLQVFFLVSAAGVHFFRARRYAVSVLDRRVRILLFFLCLGFALRELDIDKFGDGAVWETVEFLVRGGVAAAFVIYLWRTRSYIPLIWNHRRSLVAAPLCLLTFVGGLFYSLSWPFDNKIFPISASLSQLLEEVLELWACILLLASAKARGIEGAKENGAG